MAVRRARTRRLAVSGRGAVGSVWRPPGSLSVGASSLPSSSVMLVRHEAHAWRSPSCVVSGVCRPLGRWVAWLPCCGTQYLYQRHIVPRLTFGISPRIRAPVPGSGASSAAFASGLGPAALVTFAVPPGRGGGRPPPAPTRRRMRLSRSGGGRSLTLRCAKDHWPFSVLVWANVRGSFGGEGLAPHEPESVAVSARFGRPSRTLSGTA